MTKKSAANLKLHVEDLCADLSFGEVRLAGQESPPLAALSRSFESLTGWQLCLQHASGEVGATWSAPIHGGGDLPVARLAITPVSPVRRAGEEVSPPDANPTLDLHLVRPLALAIAGLLSELAQVRHALWQREAELAAGVPISSRPDEELHLAQRLEAVLQGGAQAVGCPAAGLYLLDEGTSSLKLRASFGLPQHKLLEPARPLRGAVADLEALVGHAVVLEDTSVLTHWRCPEDFPAAVCVPVASPTIPLGTLWVFSDEPRDFTPDETNLIEIVAGRLAADLEREMLLSAGAEARQRDRQFDIAKRWQQDRLPCIVPLLDDYELAGWTLQAEGLGGDFHDWSVLPDGRLALVVGDAHGTRLAAGLNAAAVQAAVKAHGGYRHDAGQLLSRVNDTLWTGSAGDQFAALAYGLIQPDTGILEYALAGDVAAILLSQGVPSREILTAADPPLGTEPERRYQPAHRVLTPGDVLVVLSGGARNATDQAGLRIGEASIAALLAKHPHESAEQLATLLRHLLDRGPADGATDMTVLILKRRP